MQAAEADFIGSQQMKQQIEFVEKRDGKEGAVDYALRALKAYRNVARYRNPETGARHFAHIKPFRSPIVQGIYEIRSYLRNGK